MREVTKIEIADNAQCSKEGTVKAESAGRKFFYGKIGVKRFTAFVLLAAILILLFVYVNKGYATSPLDTSMYEVVKVEAGDTLSGIAEKALGKDSDSTYISNAEIRSLVNDILEINGMNSEQIKEGDYLNVPKI
jgi:LysM repeat protein